MSSSPTDRRRDPGLIQVTLPELGPDALEAVIVAWQGFPGDRVEPDQPICVVETHGMRAAVASSASGRIVRLLAGVGTRVEPGASLAEIELEATVPSPPDSEPEPIPEPEPMPIQEPEPEPAFDPLGADPEPAAAASEQVDLASFHSPAVQRLAAEHGVDLSAVEGAGRGGRIRKEDVLTHLGH